MQLTFLALLAVVELSYATVRMPAAKCDLKSLRADFVFIVDSSSNISDVTFRKLINFIRYVAVGYTIQLPYAQFAVTTVSNFPGAGGSISFNDFNANPGHFLLQLDNLFRDGGDGQNLTAAIDYVKDNFLGSQNGYRTDQNVQHNVIYLTGTSSPTDPDAAIHVANLKSDFQLGFLVVAPFIDEPSDLLLSLGGCQCGYYPKGDGDLITGAVDFVNDIICGNPNICAM